MYERGGGVGGAVLVWWGVVQYGGGVLGYMMGTAREGREGPDHLETESTDRGHGYMTWLSKGQGRFRGGGRRISVWQW
jgi:hypothetical protein